MINRDFGWKFGFFCFLAFFNEKCSILPVLMFKSYHFSLVS